MKNIVAWSVVLTGAVGVLLSYYGIWILMAYFAAGLSLLASLAILLSGPVAGVGAVIASRNPRESAALWVGVSAFVAWLALWVLMFTVFGFSFGD